MVGILNHHKAIMQFRYLGYKTYVEIGEYLDIPLNEGENNLSFKSKISEFSHYEGNYGTDNFSTRIWIEDEKIWWEDSGSKQIIIPISKTRFQLQKFETFASFSLGDDGIPVNLKIGYFQQQYVLKRVNNE
jgi:hypothetical protein